MPGAVLLSSAGAGGKGQKPSSSHIPVREASKGDTEVNNAGSG